MAGFAPSLSSAREYYADLGFDTLPLMPESKQARVKAWQSRPSLELWQNAQPNSNIGIRCGGASRLAVLDCDEKQSPGTAKKVLDYLLGIGYQTGSYPEIRTASGTGRHIYLALDHRLEGNYVHLNKSIGAGEFRYGAGAYVVAPPSIVGESGVYSLISGDFRKLPAIEYKDLTPILQLSTGLQQKTPYSRSFSRYARRLLMGEIPESFPSRSEAEQSLIVSLINTGHDFASILNLFQRYPAAGKFREMEYENPDRARAYLLHSYQSGKSWSDEHTSEGRQIAENAIVWALSRPWPGRTGAYDRDVFLAHAEISRKCGKVIYSASCRTLAELANISHQAAANATRRLREAELIVLEDRASASLSARYSLSTVDLQVSNADVISGDFSHDLFSYQGLGKSSKFVVANLAQGPKSIDDLVLVTGKTKPTITKCLERMSKIRDFHTGEIVSMVSSNNDEWSLNPNLDFDQLAELLGVAGIRDRRKTKHLHERELHTKSLRWGQ